MTKRLAVLAVDSRNNYDVKEGVKDTHRLTMPFNGLVGNPSRMYGCQFTQTTRAGCAACTP